MTELRLAVTNLSTEMKKFEYGKWDPVEILFIGRSKNCQMPFEPCSLHVRSRNFKFLMFSSKNRSFPSDRPTWRYLVHKMVINFY